MSAVRWVVWPEAPEHGDAADWVAAGGTPEQLAQMIVETPPWAVGEQQARPTGYTAAELQRMVFTPPRFAVGDIIAEGLMLLAGRPKLGKSWLALHLCAEVARGGLALGRIRVQQGEALYMALEDGDRRVQERLGLMLGEDPWPDGLHIYTEWPTADQGGAAVLADWLSMHPDCRLVVVDTFKRIRARPNAKARLYDDDYEAMQPFAALARAAAVGVVAVMHARKGEADDPLDLISGTTGLSGAADAAMVLRRERGQADASLFVTGRDIEEKDMALKWDAEQFLWSWLGDAAEFRQSKERQELLAAVTAVPGMKPAEIADSVGKSRGSVRFLLFKLAHAGMVRVKADGTYWPGIDNPTWPGRQPSTSANNTSNSNTATAQTPQPPVSANSTDSTDSTYSAVSDAAQMPFQEDTENENVQPMSGDTPGESVLPPQKGVSRESVQAVSSAGLPTVGAEQSGTVQGNQERPTEPMGHGESRNQSTPQRAEPSVDAAPSGTSSPRRRLSCDRCGAPTPHNAAQQTACLRKLTEDMPL